MTITQKQRITIAKKKIRCIELTEEERRIDEQICGRQDESVVAVQKIKKDKLTILSPVREKKDKKEWWRGKVVNWDDERIPLGKRKNTYIRYLLSQGIPLINAQKSANKKFGFERKGKYLVLLGNAYYMDYPSFKGFSWEDASGIDCKRAESVIIVSDTTYAPFDIVKGGLLSANTMFGNLPPMGWDGAKEWAKKHGYKVSTQYLYP